MKRQLLAATVALVALPAPASANHILNLGTAYDSRGQCEAASARFSVEDRPSLLQRFPDTFSNIGLDRLNHLICSKIFHLKSIRKFHWILIGIYY